MEGVLTVFSESNLSSEVVLLPLTTPVCLRISMFLWLLHWFWPEVRDKCTKVTLDEEYQLVYVQEGY